MTSARSSITWPLLAVHPPRVAELLFYNGLFIAILASGYAALARVPGLAHLGLKVDLVSRLIHCGRGDPEPADALRRDEEGDSAKLARTDRIKTKE